MHVFNYVNQVSVHSSFLEGFHEEWELLYIIALLASMEGCDFILPRAINLLTHMNRFPDIGTFLI